MSLQKLALESLVQLKDTVRPPRLPGQGQSASLQCSVPPDQHLAQLAGACLIPQLVILA